jgi:hypothetical protein
VLRNVIAQLRKRDWGIAQRDCATPSVRDYAPLRKSRKSRDTSERAGLVPPLLIPRTSDEQTPTPAAREHSLEATMNKNETPKAEQTTTETTKKSPKLKLTKENIRVLNVQTSVKAGGPPTRCTDVTVLM